MKPISRSYSFTFFETSIIVVFWLLLFASPLIFSQYQDNINWNYIFDIWKNNLCILLVFLIQRFLLKPRFFFRAKKISYLILTITTLAASTGFVLLNDKGRNLPPLPDERIERPLEIQRDRANETERPFSDPPPQKNMGQMPAYAHFLLLAILLVGFDAGLQISMRWFGMEQEKYKLLKENIENQLAFLRNQISPHFFMNTLNNIHALVDLDSEEAKGSIVKLSNLMRHLLYDSEEKMCPIKKEVEFIKSYIELMQLRFTEKVEIKVDIPDEIPDKSIPSLLFTSMLENAFKHGISYSKTSFVFIKMSFSEDRLIFIVENSNHSRKTVAPSGIGIENTRKSLDLIYKSNYDLIISENENKYSVKLSIPI